jgi:hypothetical protein
MSTKLGWFGVRDCSRTRLIEALRTIAAANKKLELPSDGFLLESARGHTSASLLGWEYAAGTTGSIAISHGDSASRIPNPALSQS